SREGDLAEPVLLGRRRRREHAGAEQREQCRLDPHWSLLDGSRITPGPSYRARWPGHTHAWRARRRTGAPRACPGEQTAAPERAEHGFDLGRHGHRALAERGDRRGRRDRREGVTT